MTKESIARIYQETPALNFEPSNDDFDEFPAPPGWPELKSPALRGLAGDFVRAVCKGSEADPAAVLATTLTAFGAALGSKVNLWVGDTKHFPRLYVLVVGNSSKARKGTSATPVRRLLEAAAKKNTSFNGMQISDGPCSSAEGLIYAVRNPSEGGDLGAADKRLLVFEGEFASVLRVMQREGNLLSPALRTFWDHGNQKPLTKTNPIGTTDAHVCIVGHITQQELGIYLSNADMWNGLANRLVFVAAKRSKLISFPERTAEKVLESFACRFSEALNHAHQVLQVVIADDARDKWTELYEKLSEEKPGILGSVTARSEAQVLRIAMIYALLDQTNQIGKEHLESALAFWEYSTASASLIFGKEAINSDQQKIIDALKANESMSQTEIHRRVFSNKCSASELSKHLQSLEVTGKIERKTEKTNGPPRTIWSLAKSRVTSSPSSQLSISEKPSTVA